MAAAEQFLKSDNALIIAIDNPHLCLGRRISAIIDRLVGRLGADKVTVCGNCPPELATLARRNPAMRLIPIASLGHVENELEFMRSFHTFETVPLLRQIRMPVSGLDLYDVAGFDGLLYPYRASCELDWSTLDGLEGPYDLLVIVGGSHFNYPLPERILAEVKSRRLVAPETRCVGVPVGPLTGPLSPHWIGSCDRVLAPDARALSVLEKLYPDLPGEVCDGLLADILSPVSVEPETSDRIGVLIDWTFLHTWQLKAILGELAQCDLRSRIRLSLTAIGEETSQMLWAKWSSILEDFAPEWVYTNGNEYYRAVSGADVVIGFVCGRDVWAWRREQGGLIVCDFAGWRQAFEFEGPDPVTSPKQCVSKLEQLVALAGERR
jgi:hypothetical protein